MIKFLEQFIRSWCRYRKSTTIAHIMLLARKGKDGSELKSTKLYNFLGFVATIPISGVVTAAYDICNKMPNQVDLKIFVIFAFIPMLWLFYDLITSYNKPAILLNNLGNNH